MPDQMENRIKNIESLIRSAQRNLKKASGLVNSLKSDIENSYSDVPGTLGVFDGKCMITPEGKSYEVNPNYAAKSMLVVGDNLKMVEEGDKKLFKQISKVPRKTSEGVLNKKEGKWYAITDTGSYQLLDVAVDFRRGQINDEIEVLIPEDDLSVEYAALSKLKKEDERPVIDEEKAEESEEDKKEEKKEKKSTKKNKIKSKAKKKDTKKKTSKKKEKKEDEKEDDDKEKTQSILEEDDLI